MSLAKKLLSNSRISRTTMLTESSLADESYLCITDTPIVNMALSGHFDGGLRSGMGILAGPSKHFKTLLGLHIIANYMIENPDAVMLFYDSEKGASLDYISSAGIDLDRVVRVPIKNVEELKFDLTHQFDTLSKEKADNPKKYVEKLVVFIDSIGNLASKREADNALNENSAADMTRAKELKSLFRVVTPYLEELNVPMVAVNHTYDTLEMFSKTVMSGGQGPMLSADWVFIMGKRQLKEGKDVIGSEFVLNIEKSRTVKERSKLPLAVSFASGIDKWSGLLELAKLGGFLTSKGPWWYPTWLGEDKPVKKSQMDDAFWQSLLDHEPFCKYCTGLYKLNAGSDVSTEDVDFDDLEVDKETGEILS